MRTDYLYRVCYDGTYATIEITHAGDPDGYSTFREAKDELLGHLRMMRDEYANATREAAGLTAADVRRQAETNYGVEF